MTPLNILLLCNRPTQNADASTVTDHLDAFQKFSKHNVTPLSFLRDLPSRLDLNRFDVIVIHYTLALGYMGEHFINIQSKQRLRDFKGMKIVFIQDEYRAVNMVLDALSFLDVDILFTCVPTGEIEKVYSSKVLPGTTRINTLTGYVPENLIDYPAPQISDRPINVGYRTRKPPYWLGELGYEKWTISDKFKKASKDKTFKVDLSYDEADRIYGSKWIQFVSSCKCMLGVESGASVFDFDGVLQKKVENYVQINTNCSFYEIQDKFLKPYEGLIKLNQISPRCFEAAALRTVMVLYKGDYSGILQPWRHYVPLEKDFSNINEVLEFITDDVRLQEMADRTFKEIALNDEYSYRSFIGHFDDTVEKEFAARNYKKNIIPYSKTMYRVALLTSYKYSFRRVISIVLQKIILGTPLRRLIFKIWGAVPLNIRVIVRPLLRIISR